MSTTDKTRAALLNTMIKSKTGGEAENKTEAAKPAAKAAPKKAATKKKAVTKKAAPAKKAPAKKAPAAKVASNDPFQSRGRVWPD